MWYIVNMNNKEGILEENKSSLLSEPSDFSEADKNVLIEKIQNIRGKIELKKEELERAIQENQSADTIEVLTLELQQKNMVLRDLEENLANIAG